jgi:RNA polymerase sigma-70 factor (ECF subfamily)
MAAPPMKLGRFFDGTQPVEHPDQTMSHPQGTPERLIAKARSGDRAAQQELWRAHRRWVAAIILAHRPSSVEVDDLMQDVAVKMVSKMASLRDAASFRPWLRQIVLNICRGSARSLKPTLRLAQADTAEDVDRDSARIAMPASPIERASDLVSRHDAATRLMDQVKSLPPEYREPLLLRCVRSLTYQQISEILHLPVTTIETRLARARRMLREEVGEALLAEEYS